MAANDFIDTFDRFLGQIPEITIAIDSEGVIIWCNPHAREHLGALVGTAIEKVLDHGSVGKLSQGLFAVRDGSDLVTELVFVVNNSPILHSAHIFCYQNSIIIMAREDADDTSRFEQLSSLLSEFANLQRETSRQEHELKQQGYLLTTLTRELETERRRLLSLIDQLPEGIVIVSDSSGIIELSNHRIQELWGLKRPPENVDELPIWTTGHERVSSSLLPLYRSMTSKLDEGPVDYTILRENHNPIYVQATASPVLDDADEVVGSAMSIVDVSEHIQLQDILELQALQDPLTGLSNRRGFFDRVERALEEMRGTGSSVAVLYMDLDGFKAVNDRLGHDAGDIAIMEAGARLRKVVRENDAVARIGGDEFTVLLPQVDESVQIEMVVRRILESLVEPIKINDHSIRLPGSVGISIASDNETITPSELVRRADMAMYQAKASGTSRWAYFQDFDSTSGSPSFSLSESIHHALDTEQFEMLYRPVVDLSSGKVRQVEISMYWRSATEGLLDDNEIRARAWRAGLLHAIAERAADLAERDRPLMLEAIGNREKIVMSRHYWVEYLKEERVIEQIVEIAHDIKDTPITVWIELSGRILPGDEGAINRLMRMYDAGIRFCLSHAGDYDGDVGLLRHLPVESIVASADLVNSGLVEERAFKLLRSVVSTAHEFNIPVKAPGIESVDELRMIQELGFDLGSGPLFSRPLTAAEIIEFSVDHVFDLSNH
jgi:diguanylate cyclase (GGDEF)-like protein